MASKPENLFIQRLHKLVPKEVYREKMYNPLRRGTPDVWYSGNAGDLWVEYKWLPKLPAVIDPAKLLSPLQLQWLENRAKEGRTVWVIIGSPIGNIIIGKRFDGTISREQFLELALSNNATASAIIRQTYDSNQASSDSS